MNEEHEYKFAVVLALVATSYKEACLLAKDLVDRLTVTPGPHPDSDDLAHVELITDYEHDSQGQRVVYLHPED